MAQTPFHTRTHIVHSHTLATQWNSVRLQTMVSRRKWRPPWQPSATQRTQRATVQHDPQTRQASNRLRLKHSGKTTHITQIMSGQKLSSQSETKKKRKMKNKNKKLYTVPMSACPARYGTTYLDSCFGKTGNCNVGTFLSGQISAICG